MHDSIAVDLSLSGSLSRFTWPFMYFEIDVLVLDIAFGCDLLQICTLTSIISANKWSNKRNERKHRGCEYGPGILLNPEDQSVNIKQCMQSDRPSAFARTRERNMQIKCGGGGRRGNTRENTHAYTCTHHLTMNAKLRGRLLCSANTRQNVCGSAAGAKHDHLWSSDIIK